MRRRVLGLVAAIGGAVVLTVWEMPVTAQGWPFQVTDLRDRDQLTLLVYGDAGTGDAGQYRVGQAMFETCQEQGCDLALMLGDNIYENGIEIDSRDDSDASFREIMAQFEAKFARPYAAFEALPGFHFWAVFGNHDYRRNAMGAMITYSEFNDLWRLPALHYEVPRLPNWIQIYGMHTDSDVRRELNGLQVSSIKRHMCREDGPDRWKLLFGHHPVYNSGHHRNDSDERRTRSLVERPLILECGIHLYLSGHAHHQEHLTALGFEQVIQGAAGKSKGSNNQRDETFVTQRFFSKTFGFAIVTVDPVSLRLDFYDVLNTREKADAVVAATPDEIVRSYSWCGTRDDIGRPMAEATPCPVPTTTEE